MTLNPKHIQARGAWVLVKPEPVPKKTDFGLYMPDGNLLDRLGHVVAKVVSAGKGYWKKSGTRDIFVAQEVKKGDRVVFRGHLKAANTIGDGYCFMHAQDLVLLLDKGVKLDLSMPYDN